MARTCMFPLVKCDFQMVYFAAFRVNITLVCGVSFGEPTDYAHTWGSPPDHRSSVRALLG